LERERGEEQDDARLRRKVYSILKDVRERGDEALIRYTSLFDRVRLSAVTFGWEKRRSGSLPKRSSEICRDPHESSLPHSKVSPASKKGMSLSFHRKEKGIQIGQRSCLSKG